MCLIFLVFEYGIVPFHCFMFVGKDLLMPVHALSNILYTVEGSFFWTYIKSISLPH